LLDPEEVRVSGSSSVGWSVEGPKEIGRWDDGCLFLRGTVVSTPSISELFFHGTVEVGADVVGVMELEDSFLG